jgi:hypothetical protein
MCAHCPWLYFVQIFYSAISVTENLEENLGNEFSDSSSLKLIDVLGNEITDLHISYYINLSTSAQVHIFITNQDQIDKS